MIHKYATFWVSWSAGNTKENIEFLMVIAIYSASIKDMKLKFLKMNPNISCTSNMISITL